MRDPYSVLGLRRNAGPDEIKAAWRAVAKAVHPDQNRDDPLASARFAEAGRAYEVLKDPKLRNRYDHARREADLRRMEAMKRKSRDGDTAQETLDPETAEEMIARIFGTEARPRQPERKPTTAAPQRPTPKADAASEPKAETKNEPKAEFKAEPPPAEVKPETTSEAKPEAPERPAGFGVLPRAAAPAAELVSAIVRRIRGASAKTADKVPDISCEVTVSIEDIFRREKPTATLPDGQTLKVALPPGTTDGSIVRLKDQGYRLNGMLRGDLVVTVRIASDERFRPEGLDLRTTLPLDLQDAVLGCQAKGETPTGPVTVTIPAWSGSNHVVRLQGHGLPNAEGGRGDLLVEVRVMLGETPDDRIIDLMRTLRSGLVL